MRPGYMPPNIASVKAAVAEISTRLSELEVGPAVDVGVIAKVKHSWDPADAADNDAAIATAVDLARASGRNTVVIPDGHYYVSDTVDLLAHVAELRGGAVILKWAPDSSGTGKAMLRVRQKRTRVYGISFLGEGIPDTGIDLYPTTEGMLQGCLFSDLAVTGAKVGAWAHDPPSGQQQEMIVWDRCRITGSEAGIKCDKRHCDLWTFRHCYIGHTTTGGASMLLCEGSDGMGLELDHTWLIGPSTGLDVRGQWDDVTFRASGAEGPARAIDISTGGIRTLWIYGQGTGAPVHIGVNRHLAVHSEGSIWAARSDGSLVPWVVEGSLAWDSVRDHLYLDGQTLVSAAAADGVDRMPAFAAAVKSGSGSFQFAPVSHWERVVPEPLRVGGPRTAWYLPAGRPMLEVQSLTATHPIAHFRDRLGALAMEITAAGPVLRSPDGSRWLLSVSNAGAISAVKL